MDEYALGPRLLRRSLGVALLNALWAAADSPYALPQDTLREGLHILPAAQIVLQNRNVMVGVFISIFQRSQESRVSLQIVDNTATRSGPRSESSGWHRRMRQNELGLTSVVIISGSSLVECGIDDLLGASGAARVHMMI